jgi:hypothetical protein
MLMRIANTSRLALDVQIPSARNAEVALKKGAPIQVVGRADVLAEALSVAPSVSDNQMLTLRATVTKGAQAPPRRRCCRCACPLPMAARAGRAAAVRGAPGRQGLCLRAHGHGLRGHARHGVGQCFQSVRVTGGLQAGEEVATASVIALKAAWQGKGGSN